MKITDEESLPKTGGSIDLLKTIPGAVTTLSLVEIGLGSLIHSLHLPFGGHLLSLNQTVILLWAVDEKESKDAAEHCVKISFFSSGWKVFSPAGKTLTPMLAIFSQGVLLATGLRVFGNGFFGALIGAGLSSLWGFAQPLLLLLLFFGNEWMGALFGLAQKTLRHFSLSDRWVVWGFLGFIFLKVLVAFGLAYWAKRATIEKRERYLGRLKGKAFLPKSLPEPPREEESSLSAMKGALRDLLRPFWLGSFLLSGVLFYFSAKWSEDGAVTERQVVQWLLRPLACAFLFFWAMRTKWIRQWLKNRGKST
jgi:hypothetical protein